MYNQENLLPQSSQEVIEDALGIDEELLEGVTGGTEILGNLVDAVKQCFGCGSEVKLNEGEYVMYDPDEGGRPLTLTEGKEAHKAIVLKSPQHPGWEVRGAKMGKKTVAVSYPFNIS